MRCGLLDRLRAHILRRARDDSNSSVPCCGTHKAGRSGSDVAPEPAGIPVARGSIEADPTAILRVVRRFWGFDSLRPMQAEAIRAGIERRDSLVVMPTGGGKSLCYQVPPAVAGRTDIVVSPLIALMKDQIDALRACGYPAAAYTVGWIWLSCAMSSAGLAPTILILSLSRRSGC